MGCMPSKQRTVKMVSPRSKIVPEDVVIDKEAKLASIKTNILDAIKRGDIILFEKTMHTYQVKPTEIIGPAEEKKTILHYLAEFNFAEAMDLALEYILQHQVSQAAQALNVKDSNGNTPAILCCLFDSSETLDILLGSGYINLNLKNMMGQTAQMIASDNESPCLHYLINPNTRDTTRTIIASSQQTHSVHSPKTQQLNPTKDEVVDSAMQKGSRQLRSIHSIKKESKISQDSRLYQVLNELTAKNANFEDEEFPHDNDSLAPEDIQQELFKQFEGVKWLKAQQIFSGDIKNLSLFEGIDINDVSQSPLAGCDLYSALAIMTEFPQRLLRMFTTKEPNKQGAYSVKVLLSSTPVEVLLDDYFPCTKDNVPIFSRPNTNELWFLLAEKAFAKLYGSYSDIKNIQINDALEAMTGMPTAQLTLKDTEEDDLWSNMLDYDKRNYIFCAGNHSVSEDETKNRIFSIVRLYDTDNYKIIKLRDHFGDFEWNGEFSDGSPLWTKELRDEIGHYNGENNCFFMSITEFIKHFEYLTVCFYHENWLRTSEEVVVSHKAAAFFEILVDREMEAILSVHQKLPRFVDDEDYDISPVEILVAEELQEEGLIKKVAKGEKDAFIGKSTVYADDKIKIKLSEGRYIIRVKVRWVDNGHHDFTMSAFSSYPLTLKKVKSRDHPDFLEQVYLDAGARSCDRYQLGNKCEFTSSWMGPHLYLYGVNKGTKTWNLEINFNKLENLQLCKKYRTSENVLKMVIPPRGQAVAYAKRINTKTVELNWNFNQSWV